MNKQSRIGRLVRALRYLWLRFRRASDGMDEDEMRQGW